VRGWIGCRGRSIAIIRPSIPPFAPRRSRWCTTVPRWPFCRTSREPRVLRLRMLFSAAGMRCSLRSVSASSRRSSCRRSTTTPTTGMRSLRSARGCGCASFTARRSPSTPVRVRSSGRDGRGCSGCSSALAAWRIVYSFRKAPAYMMSSTSASSSSIAATLQGRRVPFLRHRMAALCLSLSAFCSPSSGEVHGAS